MLVEHVVVDRNGDHHFDRTGHAGSCRYELDHAVVDRRVVDIGGRHAVHVLRSLHVARHPIQNDRQAARRVEGDREHQIAAFVAAHVSDRHRRRSVVILNRASGHLAIGDHHRHTSHRADRHRERLVVLVEHVVGDRHHDGVLGLTGRAAGGSRFLGHEDYRAAAGHVVRIRNRRVVHVGGCVVARGPVDRDLLAARTVEADREHDLAVFLQRHRIGDRCGRRLVVVHDHDHVGRVRRGIAHPIARILHVHQARGDDAVDLVEHVVLGRHGELRGLLSLWNGDHHRPLADCCHRLVVDRDSDGYFDSGEVRIGIAERLGQGIEETGQREDRSLALCHRIHIGSNRNLDIRSNGRGRSRSGSRTPACCVNGTHMEHVRRPVNGAIALHTTVIQPVYGHAPRRSAAGDHRPCTIAAGSAFALVFIVRDGTAAVAGGRGPSQCHRVIARRRLESLRCTRKIRVNWGFVPVARHVIAGVIVDDCNLRGVGPEGTRIVSRTVEDCRSDDAVVLFFFVVIDHHHQFCAGGTGRELDRDGCHLDHVFGLGDLDVDRDGIGRLAEQRERRFGGAFGDLGRPHVEID